MGNSAVQDMGRLDLSSGQWDGQPAVLLDLGASQTLQSAPDLHAALVEATERGLPLVVDASSIEHLTTSAVQLLIAAGRRMAAADTVMAIQKPTAEFRNALGDLGIDPVEQGWAMEGVGDG